DDDHLGERVLGEELFKGEEPFRGIPRPGRKPQVQENNLDLLFLEYRERALSINGLKDSIFFRKGPPDLLEDLLVIVDGEDLGEGAFCLFLRCCGLHGCHLISSCSSAMSQGLLSRHLAGTVSWYRKSGPDGGPEPFSAFNLQGAALGLYDLF